MVVLVYGCARVWLCSSCRTLLHMYIMHNDGPHTCMCGGAAQDTKGMSPMHYANVNGHEECAAHVARHANTLQLEQSQEAIRQACMGYRDTSHKQLSQLVGAHVMTGSTGEHQRYYRHALVPTRKQGWTRNDLIHNVSSHIDNVSSHQPGPTLCLLPRRLPAHELFESLSSTITTLASHDSADMMAQKSVPRAAMPRDAILHSAQLCFFSNSNAPLTSCPHV